MTKVPAPPEEETVCGDYGIFVGDPAQESTFSVFVSGCTMTQNEIGLKVGLYDVTLGSGIRSRGNNTNNFTAGSDPFTSTFPAH